MRRFLRTRRHSRRALRRGVPPAAHGTLAVPHPRAALTALCACASSVVG
eukprot:gene4630-49541_t